MFKQVLTGSCVILSLLVGNLSAQAQQPKPVSPSTQPQQTVAPNTKISSDELKKFVSSVKKLIVIEQGANQDITQIIGKSGLSQQRFFDIYKSQQNPPVQPTQAITPQEKQQFDKAFTNLVSVQKKVESQRQQVLQSEGLKPEQFDQIEAVVRQDPELLQRVRQMIKS